MLVSDKVRNNIRRKVHYYIWDSPNDIWVQVYQITKLTGAILFSLGGTISGRILRRETQV